MSSNAKWSLRRRVIFQRRAMGAARGGASGSSCGKRATATSALIPWQGMERALDTAQLVELLSQNAAAISEDLALIEAGAIKFTAFDSDVNEAVSARMRGNLARLEQVIAALDAKS